MAGLLSACLASSWTSAEVIETYQVGEGSSTSSIIFQFTNGNQYLYEVSYSDDLTGREAFDVISDAQPGFFIPDITEYDFGDALTGLEIGSDSDSGFGTPPDYLDYWHYWIRDSGEDPWEASSVGFSDRDLSDGSWDGWVFNSDLAPVPGSATVVILSGMLSTRRRRS